MEEIIKQGQNTNLTKLNLNYVIQSKEDQKSTEMEAFLSVLRNLAVHNTEGQYFSTVVAAFQKVDELGPEISRGAFPLVI